MSAVVSTMERWKRCQLLSVTETVIVVSQYNVMPLIIHHECVTWVKGVILLSIIAFKTGIALVQNKRFEYPYKLGSLYMRGLYKHRGKSESI